jgi:2-succinyl-5-enolpyruvyl-6-hydroxy-3-cyclohexene-1-carboxylate synthase
MSSNLHMAWARLFVSALADAGVRHAVLSPGSRSTPLAVAFAREARVTLDVVIDERSAAFFALGQARRTGMPSVLVCTSGSAGAHYLPALVEASMAFIPIVAVTADRPWELQDASAPQTIDQTKLFGSYARHQAELGLPDASPIALRAVQRIAAQAVARSLGPTPGPTHVNARFRKPLEPVEVLGHEPWEAELEALMAARAPRIVARLAQASEDAIGAIVDACAGVTRGLIVAGPSIGSDADARACVALARATGFALLAEATSQVRFGAAQDNVAMAGAFDAVLRSASFRRAHAPELLIEVGAPPTSAGYARYAEEHRSARRISLSPHGFSDPLGGAFAVIEAGSTEILAASARIAKEPRDAAFRDAFVRGSDRAWQAADAALVDTAMGAGHVARIVVERCPAGSTLAVGNSTVVRELDTWAPPTSKALRVLHQRGASGIDGLVAGAAGAARAGSGPVTLLLGDVSLVHDLGSLEVARRIECPLVLVVLHNDGGRIFEQLPLARREDCASELERCFLTPHGLSFGPFARGFGIAYVAPQTVSELADALDAAYARGGATLVEARVDSHEATTRAMKLWSRLDGILAMESEREERP